MSCSIASTGFIPDSVRRTFRMVINPDDRYPDAPSYKVDITSGGKPLQRINERPAPGPVLVMTRGEPVAVEIANQLGEPTAIHWHGIELESYHDGVPEFGGSSGNITPAVPPQGAFTARFTPRRAGTFIYHTHWHNAGQLSGGIYGPLIVLEPGQTWNPDTDHVIVIGLEGRYRNIPNEPFAINGETDPRPRLQHQHRDHQHQQREQRQQLLAVHHLAENRAKQGADNSRRRKTQRAPSSLCASSVWRK